MIVFLVSACRKELSIAMAFLRPVNGQIPINISIRFKTLRTLYIDTAQVGALLKVKKEESVFNARRNPIVESFIKYTVPKNTRKDTRRIRK